MTVSQQILPLIKSHCSTDDPAPGLTALADAARDRHGDSVKAVVFYGSCLRSGDLHDGLSDFYLLVDDYQSAYKNRIFAFLNWLLPPNVFYLEIPFQGKTLRAKYALLTLADFHKGATRWFHSYVWGRFAQRCGVVYVQDEAAALQVQQAIAGAAATFIKWSLPQMKGSFTARDLWGRGLSLSYRSELRSEQPDGSVRLFDANSAYYEALTEQILDHSFGLKLHKGGHYESQTTAEGCRLNMFFWRLRFVQGKALSVLRLLKGLLTFKGGIDYVLWKIERHSGESVEVSPGLRRFPPIAVLVIFWRLYRKGGFR